MIDRPELAASARRLYDDERGQLVALFALGMITLLLFVSLSMNVGQAVVRRHQAQVLADNGALAGAAVQARGLNQIARVNAASLRLFNVLQIRSRVGGYHELRLPIVGIIQALLSSRKIPSGSQTFEDPNAPKGKGKRVRINVANIMAGVARRAFGKMGQATRDDDDAFRKMEPIFANARAYMRGANIIWEFRARQVAREVTLANVETLVSRRAAQACRSSDDCMRPVLGTPTAKGAWESIKGLRGLFNAQRGKGKGRQSFAAWAKSLLNLRNQRLFTALETAGAPRLIPQWQNRDGDPLVVRYWTDTTKAEKVAFMAAAAGVMAAIPPLWPAIPTVTRFLRMAINIESHLRKALAPKWHDMNVTLHRKTATGRTDPFSLDTRFVFWVKLPPTPPSMRIFYPFADLPAITAVAVAKPVGGNVGSHPRAQPLSRTAPGLGHLAGAFAKVADFADDVLPENEHLYSLSDYGARRTKGTRRPRPATGGIAEEKPVRISQVYTAAEMRAMGFNPRNPANLFWYTSPQFPYYEPRLVPLQKAYMNDIAILDKNSKARLQELYGTKKKARGGGRRWPF